MFHGYPYTDFHELNLDWLLQEVTNIKKKVDDDIISVNEAYKEILALFADIEAGVEQIVDDYLSTAENIALRSDLTSNDIDIEEVFNFHFDDGRYTGNSEYCVFQSFMQMNDGNFVAVANDETGGDVGKVRVYSNDGILMRERTVTVGHANDATTNGTDKIYVAHSITDGGTELNKISVINYADLSLDRVIEMPTIVNAISYNYDKNQFITKTKQYVSIWDSDLSYLIESWEVENEFSEIYRWKYPGVTRQGTAYHNNQLMCIYSYPSAFVFYDLDTHKMTKMYNPPPAIGKGSVYDEIESGNCIDGNFYITAFYRDSDGKTAGNTVGRFNPWTNTQTNYAKVARYVEPLNLYVDGSTTDPKANGSIQHPYKNLTQAITALKSKTSIYTPIDIYCKEGTNVGALRATQCPCVNISVYNDNGAGQGTSFTIDGIRLFDCSQVLINHANVIHNANMGNGEYSVVINRCEVYFLNGAIDGGGHSGCINLTTDSQLKVVNTAFSNYTNTAIYAVAYSELTYDSACTFTGKPYTQGSAEIHYPTKFQPMTSVINGYLGQLKPFKLRGVDQLISQIGTYQLYENVTISAAARNSFNFILFDCGAGGYHHVVPVLIPEDSTNDMTFNLTTVRSNANYYLEGRFNISTGVLTVESLVGAARIYGIYLI